ncbi:MAG: 1-deoxy-D-xylulose-5-phosphate reductoisomerase [Candidatus Omnitrophica bacterium]|nr:1-deoxy-D-xylulose-5-phosphate reductoisomerase [Candidatus Omnitrophota bacterium]
MINISILGSTGSIGINTLRIVRTHPDKFRVLALAAKKSIDDLIAQAREFRPEVVCIYNPESAAKVQKELRSLKIRVVTGDEGLCEVSTLAGVQKVVFALVGAVGLAPIFAALKAKKDLAIANKEPLVIAGKLLVEEAKKTGVKILPIDSEHSGLWQCLEGQRVDMVKKLILTSSGGPFHKKKGSLTRVTPKQALNHPKWKMGAKITIDSATLMNKGLEVIEAANLFGFHPDKIEVLVHPEAVIHAMVEFVDGTHLANLAITDMRLPIQYALTYPARLMNHLPTLDLVALHRFHFERPDRKRFPCLDLGYEASQKGGSLPAVLNAANEVAVEAFLKEEISFLKIPSIIENVMKKHRLISNPGLQDLIQSDLWAREQAKEQL